MEKVKMISFIGIMIGVVLLNGCINSGSSNKNRSTLMESNVTLKYFWSKYCPTCKKEEPIIQEFLKEHPQLNFIRIDVDKEEFRNEMRKYRVMGTPTYILIKGDVVLMASGFKTKKELVEFICPKLKDDLCLEEVGKRGENLEGNKSKEDDKLDKPIERVTLNKERDIETLLSFIFINETEFEDEHEEGKVKADVFIDFQCSNSRKVIKNIQKIENLFFKTVEFNIKHFPLKEDTKYIAQAAECARDQGKLMEFTTCAYDKYFKEGKNTSQREVLTECVWKLGLNEIKFSSCLDFGKKRKIIEENLVEGTEYGIIATPTIIVDGRYMLTGSPSLSDLEKVFCLSLEEEYRPDICNTLDYTKTDFAFGCYL